MGKACCQTKPASVAPVLILTSFRDRPGTSVSTLGDARRLCYHVVEDFYHLSIRRNTPFWITIDDERVGPQCKVDGAPQEERALSRHRWRTARRSPIDPETAGTRIFNRACG